MDKSTKMLSRTPLFQVYLRLRPPIQPKLAEQKTDPWLIVEPADASAEDTTKVCPTRITLQPPSGSNRLYKEEFSFAKVFEENASQLDVLEETGTVEMLRSVLQTGRDGLVVTLGVTGSGKSHTILGSESQRGLTQMTLDVLFTSIGDNIRGAHNPGHPTDAALLASLKASDVSDAHILSATTFLKSATDDGNRERLSRARTPMSRTHTSIMDSHSVRRPPVSHQSTFPQQPDVSSYSIEIEPEAEYAVLVSMYEVYNNHILDLLCSTASSNVPAMTTRPGAALQNELRQRLVLFKKTGMSPDRKVVAGLRKIVCGSYQEAMQVLQAGLEKRRVECTSSNDKSSRSHGFFCIEVRKKCATQAAWSGGTMSIVDMAGSERAQSAQTDGYIFGQGRQINTDLSTLRSCLEEQNECKPAVAFRRRKLTELLFANSIPASSRHAATYRPQRAIMIVTADPAGDFNATSYLLGASVLARKWKILRVASTTNTVLRAASGGKGAHGGRTVSQDINNGYLTAQELEQATNEATRFSEKCVALEVRLAEEEMKRAEAEAAAEAAEDQLVDMEQQVREECWIEMEQHLEEEKERWRNAWEQEKTQNEAFMDGKLGILEKTRQFKIHEDEADARVEELERENESLRAKLRALEQDLLTRSPTKKSRAAPKSPVRGMAMQETSNISIATNPILATLRGRDSDVTIKAKSSEGDMHGASEISPRKQSLRSSNVSHATVEEQPPGTGKKQRKLTARKWDLGDPDRF